MSEATAVPITSAARPAWKLTPLGARPDVHGLSTDEPESLPVDAVVFWPATDEGVRVLRRLRLDAPLEGPPVLAMESDHDRLRGKRLYLSWFHTPSVAELRRIVGAIAARATEERVERLALMVPQVFVDAVGASTVVRACVDVLREFARLQQVFLVARSPEIFREVPQEATAPQVPAPVDLFSPAVRSMLEVAGALARNEQSIGVGLDHLVRGIFETSTAAQRFFASFKLTTADEIRAYLEPSNRRHPRSDFLQPTRNLPTRSAHADEAFRRAADVARSLGAPLVRVDHVLLGILAVENCPTVQALWERGLTLQVAHAILTPGWENDAAPQQSAVEEVAPGYSPDVPIGVDQLGVTPDVHALASLVVARDIEPPLSIGLFGDWGSGKSFFMNLLQDRVRTLTAASQAAEAAGRPTSYCTHVVQLTFQAWHYIDTKNLWSTLLSEIFAGLQRALVAEKKEAQAGNLLEQITRRDAVANAEAQRREAEQEVRSTEQRVEAIASRRREIRSEIVARGTDPRSVAKDVAVAALSSESIRKHIDAASRTLGVAGDATSDARARIVALEGVGGGLRASWMFMRARPARTILLTLVLAALLGVAGWLWIEEGTIVHALGAAVLAALVWLSPAVGPAWRALGEIGKAREERHKALDRKLADLQQKEDEEAKRLDEQKKRLAEMDEALDRLHADRQLRRFIEDRHASVDYRQHLGVIAHARSDLEELTNRLAAARAACAAGMGKATETTAELPIIERIVLYIDDLDRCPEHQVMEVLQAVHLLLAFKLFVVVVGVDPRALFHAVRKHGPLADERDAPNGEGGLGWVSTTPQDYLEKIFQIPYALPPIGAREFAWLVSSLLPSAPAREDTKSAAPESAASARIDRSRLREDVEAPTADFVASPRASSPPPTLMLTPKSLEITTFERTTIQALAPLAGGPRATKRFINLYRLVRASLHGEDLAVFIGSESAPGEHRAVLVLLALLCGFPKQGAIVVQEVAQWKDEERFSEFMKRRFEARRDSTTDGERWGRMLRAIAATDVGVTALPVSMFRKWSGRVARHSFDVRRAVP